MNFISLLRHSEAGGRRISASRSFPFAPLRVRMTLALILTFSGLPASAQEGPPNASKELVVDLNQDAKKSEALGPTEEIPMDKKSIGIVTGRSQLMRFIQKFNRISISDPEVLDFLILSPNELLLNARKEGSANLIVWDIRGNVSVFDVGVTKDPALLYEVLRQIDPSGKFEIYPSQDVFVIKGEASNSIKVKEVEKAANAFAEGSVSLVKIADVKQILLKVRYIQITRSQNFDFGLDLEVASTHSLGVAIQRLLPGDTNAQTSDDAESTLVSGDGSRTMLRNIFGPNDEDFYSINYTSETRELFGAVKALEAKGIVKTIARPNLLAKDGEEATFLVGGEAAIVTSTEDSVNVQYKEFGTKLKFTPEILDDGKIRLTVEPEVSSLNQANGVTVGNTEVPGFDSTKVKSIVELRENETFVVGGLLQQKENTVESGVPYLRRLPIIGRLFESTNQEWEEIEFMVLITPQILTADRHPLPAESEEGDILSKATQLDPFRVGDKQGEAIQKYLKENKRFMDQKVKKVKDKKAPAAVQITPKQTHINGKPSAKVLDDIESQLKWDETHPKVKASG